jgi:hypothetical protein
METERRNKLEELRVAHNKNLERVRQADRALLAAQKAADKSFFALTAFRDQQAVAEQLAAQEVLKVQWQKSAGKSEVDTWEEKYRGIWTTQVLILRRQP